jgi:hypothetical protein
MRIVWLAKDAFMSAKLTTAAQMHILNIGRVLMVRNPAVNFMPCGADFTMVLAKMQIALPSCEFVLDKFSPFVGVQCHARD